jgi:hypothetical protein
MALLRYIFFGNQSSFQENISEEIKKGAKSSNMYKIKKEERLLLFCPKSYHELNLLMLWLR